MKTVLLLLFFTSSSLGQSYTGRDTTECCQEKPARSCTAFKFGISALGSDVIRLENFGAVLKLREKDKENYVYGNDKLDLIISADANTGAIYSQSVELYVIETCSDKTRYLNKLDLSRKSNNVASSSSNVASSSSNVASSSSNVALKGRELSKDKAEDRENQPYLDHCKYLNGVVSFRRTSFFPVSAGFLGYLNCQTACNNDFLCIGWTWRTSSYCQLNRFFIFIAPGIESGPLNLAPGCDPYTKGCRQFTNIFNNRRLFLALTSITPTLSGQACADLCNSSGGCVRWFWLSFLSTPRCFIYEETYPNSPGYFAGTKPCF